MSDEQTMLTCIKCKSTNVTLDDERREPMGKAWGGQVVRWKYIYDYTCNGCGHPNRLQK